MSKTNRLLALDLFRGIALILMIEQHLGSWLWKDISSSDTYMNHPIIVLTSLLGGLAAPFFIIATGVSATLLFEKSKEAFSSIVVKRGFILLLFAYVLNMAAFHWFSWKSWYILHFLGFALLVSPLIVKRKTKTLLFSVAFLIVASSLIHVLLDVPQSLSNADMGGNSIAMLNEHSTLQMIFRIITIQGHFSIIPWLPTFVLGVIGGRCIVERSFIKLLTTGGYTLFCGVLLLVIGIIFTQFHTTYLPDILHSLFSIRMLFYPISPAMVLILSGASLLFLAATFKLQEKLSIRESSPVITAGRSSLSFLFIHIILFREVTRPLGIFRTLEEWQTVLITTISVFSFIYISKAWSRINFKYGLEWLLRKV